MFALSGNATSPHPKGRAMSRTIEVDEKAMQASVVEAAHLGGWLCYHTHDSRRSTPGFPDLVLVRGRRCLFVELKAAGGRVSDAQNAWIRALTAAGQTAVIVWAIDSPQRGDGDWLVGELIDLLTSRERA